MRYANVVAGRVSEVIEQLVDEVPIEQRYHPDFVAQLIRIPEGVNVSPGDSFDGQVFGPPPPPPTRTIAEAIAQRDALLGAATLRIAPLQDAVDLDVATPEEVAALQLWKRYRVDVSRVDKQPGYPAVISWPEMPS